MLSLLRYSISRKQLRFPPQKSFLFPLFRAQAYLVVCAEQRGKWIVVWPPRYFFFVPDIRFMNKRLRLRETVVCCCPHGKKGGKEWNVFRGRILTSRHASLPSQCMRKQTFFSLFQNLSWEPAHFLAFLNQTRANKIPDWNQCSTSVCLGWCPTFSWIGCQNPFLSLLVACPSIYKSSVGRRLIRKLDRLYQTGAGGGGTEAAKKLICFKLCELPYS